MAVGNSRPPRRVVATMTKNIRVGVQLWPGGTPDYPTWREAVLTADGLGVDAIFGYDHFHKPAVERNRRRHAGAGRRQPDVNNFEGWTALASWAEITTRADIGLLVTGHRLPQPRPARRHGPHRRPHQRRPTDPRPRIGLVRKGLHHIRIRLRHHQVAARPFRSTASSASSTGSPNSSVGLSASIPDSHRWHGRKAKPDRSSPSTPTSGTPSPPFPSSNARTRCSRS